MTVRQEQYSARLSSCVKGFEQGGIPVGLNKAQRIAVNHMDGPMMVLAGPGAGKTRVITERVKALVEHGTDPDSILVITFTRAAAGEMKGRFQALMEGQRLPVTFGTFHGIYFGILKHAYGYTGSDILSEQQKHGILRELAEKAGVEDTDKNELASDLAAELSCVKNGSGGIGAYHAKNCEDEAFRSIFRGYHEITRKRRKIDFDDMLLLCLDLFRKRPDILAAWQRKFRYILVDEFQDTNPVQYEVVRLLAAPEDNLFVVGDDDQSIYRFRGANPEIMLNFEKDYPKARRVLLDVNYRCTPQIVESSLKLIGHNKHRFHKDISSGRPGGAAVTVHDFADEKEENETILKLIRKYRETGVPWNDMAVLYRTNMEPRLLSEALTEQKIPFRIKEHLPNLYDHWIARDVCAYLKLAEGPMRRVDFYQIANRPKRYISRAAVAHPEVTFDEIREFYADKDWMCGRIDTMEEGIRMLSAMPPFAAINYIRKGIGYEDYLIEYAKEKGQSPDEFFETLDELQEAARPYKTTAEWFAHIQEYREELKKQEEAKTKPMDGIELMTMHASKGLEFKVVFILNANEGITPCRKAALQEDMEEERRMFYVAMTRAKDKLFVFYAKERRHRETDPSRFIDEFAGRHPAATSEP